MRHLDDLFAALELSPFRQRFNLGAHERAYLDSKGLPTVLEHAKGFIAERLAPANPRNDGKQTPFRGHPIFIAQHATATCCRGCLAKWHRIEKGRVLTPEEQAHVIAVIRRWLGEHAGAGSSHTARRSRNMPLQLNLDVDSNPPGGAGESRTAHRSKRA
jgi:hypothetical protein